MTEPITIQAGRTWHIHIPFAGKWLTANPRSTTDRYGRSKLIRDWRWHTAIACREARLPKGITPVTIHADVWYVGARPVRDRLNLAPTIKACVDGLSPEKEWTRGGKAHRSPGYGVIPDDSDRHVLSTTWELRKSPTSQPWIDLIITEVSHG